MNHKAQRFVHTQRIRALSSSTHLYFGQHDHSLPLGRGLTRLVSESLDALTQALDRIDQLEIELVSHGIATRPGDQTDQANRLNAIGRITTEG